MKKYRKCVLYAQILNPDQIKLGYSLKAQVKLLKKYAYRNKLVVEKIFSRSLDSEDKFEIFDEMLKFVKKNEINVIVFVSRRFLTMQDCIDLDAWLNEDLVREICFVDTNQILSKESKDIKKAIDWDVDIDLARYYFRSLKRAVKEETRK